MPPKTSQINHVYSIQLDGEANWQFIIFENSLRTVASHEALQSLLAGSPHLADLPPASSLRTTLVGKLHRKTTTERANLS